MPKKPTNGKKTMMFSYDKGKVKTANERLRKLETVNKLSSESPAYVSIQKYAMNKNVMSNKFYRFVTNKDGTPGIRFITPKEYRALTRTEQRYFDEAVNRFLNDNTTTKLGIEKARREAYETFLEDHKAFKWTQSEYEHFWEVYDQYRTDNEDVKAYNRLTQFLADPSVFLTDPESGKQRVLTDELIKEISDYISDTEQKRYDNIPIKNTRSNSRQNRN